MKLKISITAGLTPKTDFILEGLLEHGYCVDHILLQTNKYRRRREMDLLKRQGLKYLLTYTQNYLCFHVLKMPTTFTAFFKGRLKYLRQLVQHDDMQTKDKHLKFSSVPQDYYSCLFRINKILKAHNSDAIIIESNKLCSDTEDNPVFSLEIDLLLVIAGGILSQKVIEHPSIATLTLHNSMLPKYRGWGGAESWALYDNDIPSIGQTIFFTSVGIDDGDILYQRALNIELTENIKDIVIQNIFNGLEVLIIGINLIKSGSFERYSQDNTKANHINRRLNDQEMHIAINNLREFNSSLL